MPYRNGKIVEWKHTIRGLRKLINEAEDTEQGAIDLGKDINKLLTMCLYRKWFKRFEEDYFDLSEFSHVLNQQGLNELLSALYNYCDEELIWVDFD